MAKVDKLGRGEKFHSGTYLRRLVQIVGLHPAVSNSNCRGATPTFAL